jgi:hypothetical protein
MNTCYQMNTHNFYVFFNLYDEGRYRSQLSRMALLDGALNTVNMQVQDKDYIETWVLARHRDNHETFMKVPRVQGF